MSATLLRARHVGRVVFAGAFAIAAACAAATTGGTNVGAQVATAPRASIASAPKSDWIQMFNGRDLSDWDIKFAKHPLGDNYNDTFRVEDGLLKVRYDKWTAFNGEFGHIFYKRPFKYYLVAAEYRFVGNQVVGAGPSLAWAKRNNGIMVNGPVGAEHGAEPGLPHLARGAAPRWPQRRQAAVDGEPLHAGHERPLRRLARHAPLHQLDVQDVRRRPVGARRGAVPGRLDHQAHRQRRHGARLPEARDGRRFGQQHERPVCSCRASRSSAAPSPSRPRRPRSTSGRSRC